MLKKIIQNCISDELHHPLITNIYKIILVFVVFGTILLTLLDNHQQIHQSYYHIIFPIQIVFYFLLLVDFLLRVIGSYEHLNMEHLNEVADNKDVSRYIFSYYGIIDLVSSIPFFIIVFHIEAVDTLTILGMFSILKIARFSPALVVLKDVIISERKSLLAALYLMMILTFSISTVLYFLERNSDSGGFKTLFDSIWWAIITLATVGYGDVVPHTVLGKLLGGMAAITGFGMFALPAGILANGFADEIKRLKDIANWKMIAQVPLFSDLEFGVIADISKLLHVKRFKKNEIIIKEKAIGSSMYFILEGSVLVYRDGFSVTLKEGDFFGEIALLKNIPRTASVLAKQRCELLELTTYDFQNFIKAQPELLTEIQKVASKRVSS